MRAGFLFLLAGLAVAGTGPDPLETFRQLCATRARQAREAGTIAVMGREEWLFFGPELRHLSVGRFWVEAAAEVSKARRPENADPLTAILDFQRQLDKAGIELLFVPVPPKAVVYPDRLAEATSFEIPPPALFPQYGAFYRLLRKEGVEVLDLTPEFLADRRQQEDPLYCRHDTHWSGRACVLAARRIAAILRERAWCEEIPQRPFAHEWRTIEIAGDLWRSLGEESLPKERLRLRFVGARTDAGLEPIPPDPSSPVLLLGDSHTLVFHAGGDMHARGAGLIDQLAVELGWAVDLLGVRGSGSTSARISLYRRFRGDPDYLAAKKLVIWCLNAREFTESVDGWRRVPVVR